MTNLTNALNLLESTLIRPILVDKPVSALIVATSVTCGLRLTLGKFTVGLRVAPLPTVWQTSLGYIKSWVLKLRTTLSMLGPVENFTDTHVVRVSNYIRDTLSRNISE